MKAKFFSRIFFAVVVLIVTANCQQSPLPALKIQAGNIVPDIEVQDLKGKKTTLPLATGKIVVLNVWATWCGPCRHEMPSLDRLAAMLDDKHYSVVGLSVDTDDHVVREFLIERKVGFTSYMDPSMHVANEVFGIRAFPSTFVFGPDGRLMEVIEGWREWDTPGMVEKFTRIREKALNKEENRSN